MEFKNNPIVPSTDDSPMLHMINSSFKDKLIKERLASYSKAYDNAPREYNALKPLDQDQANGFSAISKLLITLRQQMVPYPNDYFQGRGIVLTVGKSQLQFAEVNLKMIEVSGTQLDVQIWYSSTQISEKNMIKLFDKAPKVKLSICCFVEAQCRTRTKTWQLDSNRVYRPLIGRMKKHFPYKPAAIVSATFAEVLFLDSDAYVVRDPEELFISDPMYLKFGALFFPDAYTSRQHPVVWKLLNTTCGEHEYELDSATILVDKKRVWDGLYMTKLMNDHHKLFYEYVTDGDKDTFRLGFRYMDVKYYIVMIPCATGSFSNLHFCGWTLCKTDSLAQHIYINHVHLFKHEGLRYNRNNLGYTRIGLGDPNNNSFIFSHCRYRTFSTTCFRIVENPNPEINQDKCHKDQFKSKDIEYHKYTLNESLLFEESRNNRIIMKDLSNSDSFIIESEDTLDLFDDENSDSDYDNETEDEENQKVLENHQFTLEYMEKVINFARSDISFTTVQHVYPQRQKLRRIGTIVFERFRRAREKHLPVHEIDIQRWELREAKLYNLCDCFASHHWLLNFKKSHGISSRKVTKFVSCRKTVDKTSITIVADEFVDKVSKCIPKYKLNDVLNADQSSFHYEMTSNRTLSYVGEKATYVSVISVNATTHSYTVIPIIDAVG
ncbi:unnamed protein product [Rotaria socialis]|uniref:HTH CENPB-type domain-containing protein n=1 Tax=Rotaria socialis TaxID=392032 RepID=A0A818LKH1_9BILA|nr:unnamed protein product [Rotaria socialis]